MMNHLIDQHLAPNTLRGRIATCRAFLKYLWREGILSTNLATDLKPPKRSNQGIFTFTEEQVQAILQQPGRNTFTGFRDYVMMLVLLETGMRVMELVNMTLSDVLFSEGAIRIPMGKGRKSRIVPVQQTCLQELRTYIRERGPQPFDRVDQPPKPAHPEGDRDQVRKKVLRSSEDPGNARVLPHLPAYHGHPFSCQGCG